MIAIRTLAEVVSPPSWPGHDLRNLRCQTCFTTLHYRSWHMEGRPTKTEAFKYLLLYFDNSERICNSREVNKSTVFLKECRICGALYLICTRFDTRRSQITKVFELTGNKGDTNDNGY